MTMTPEAAAKHLQFNLLRLYRQVGHVNIDLVWHEWLEMLTETIWQQRASVDPDKRIAVLEMELAKAIADNQSLKGQITTTSDKLVKQKVHLTGLLAKASKMKEEARDLESLRLQAAAQRELLEMFDPQEGWIERNLKDGTPAMECRYTDNPFHQVNEVLNAPDYTKDWLNSVKEGLALKIRKRIVNRLKNNQAYQAKPDGEFENGWNDGFWYAINAIEKMDSDLETEAQAEESEEEHG